MIVYLNIFSFDTTMTTPYYMLSIYHLNYKLVKILYNNLTNYYILDLIYYISSSK